MTTAGNIIALETLFSSECRLQGMIAENKQREMRGESHTYTESQFNQLSEQTSLALRNIMKSSYDAH